MNGIDEEQKIRSRLPVTRSLQAYMPVRLAQWLVKYGAARVRLPADVTRKPVSAGGVPCEWLIPQNSPTDRALFYLHGGAFIYGQTSVHLQMAAQLARKAGVRVLMVDYRIAPDHPFPAPLDDCVTAYRWLLRQGIAAQNIVIGGDSAGGNLAITSLMKLRDSGDPLPSAAVCLSPVADLTNKVELFKTVHDPLLHPRTRSLSSRAYIAHSDARNPLISPVFGDWHGLPPLLIYVGEDEVLRDDAVRVAALAEAAGVDVRLEIYPRMWHVWQLYPTLPQSVQSLGEVAQFIRSHTGLVAQQPQSS